MEAARETRRMVAVTESPATVEVMVHAILPDMVGAFWPHFAPWISLGLRKRSLERKYPIEWVKERMTGGEWQTWAITRNSDLAGVMLTIVREFPGGGRALECWLLAGTHMADWWDEAYNQAERFARASDCAEIVAGGREGWIRKMRRHPKTRIESSIIVEV